MDDYTSKRLCGICGAELPLTEEFFYRQKNGFHRNCKECVKARAKARYWSDPEKAKAQSRQWYRENKERANANARRWYEANQEFAKANSRRWYQENKERAKANVESYRLRNAEWYEAYRREWRERNAEKTRAYMRAYKKANAERIRELNRESRHRHPQSKRDSVRRYRERNPEKVAERQRNWQQQNKPRMNVLKQMRRARVRGLLHDFTVEDWQYALEYFDGKCAICGRDVDFWTAIAQDHWIPVTKGGPTIPANIVPLCHSKTGSPGYGLGCNNSKNNKDPHEWLARKFGEKRARHILKRIEAFFATVRQIEIDDESQTDT